MKSFVNFTFTSSETEKKKRKRDHLRLGKSHLDHQGIETLQEFFQPCSQRPRSFSTGVWALKGDRSLRRPSVRSVIGGGSSVVAWRLRARDKTAALSVSGNRPPFTSQGDLAHKKCSGVKIPSAGIRRPRRLTRPKIVKADSLGRPLPKRRSLPPPPTYIFRWKVSCIESRDA